MTERSQNSINPTGAVADTATDLNSPDFMTRICAALDMHPYTVAHRIGVSYSNDLLPLMRGSRGQIEAADHDIVFTALAQYLDVRLAGIFAVREELQRKLNNDRRKRQEQRDRILNR